MKAQTAYIYATAANGLTVRIRRDQFSTWKAAQERIRNGEKADVSQTAKQLASLMKGEK